MPFRDIIGHRRLIALLSRSIAKDSLPPSLIFSGPSGVGKYLAALSTAQALNCLNPVRDTQDAAGLPFDACGRCAACTRIARGLHPDVLTLEPNDKGNIKVDVVREPIARAGFRPFEGRRRVTIVDAADGLEVAAQNALLKVLEEPPSGSVFILVTALPDVLLPTVRSRCPQLRFRPLEAGDIARALVARKVDPDQANAVAALADGSIGRALGASAGDLAAARRIAVDVLMHAARTTDAARRIESAKALVGHTQGPASAEREQLAVYLRAISSLLRDIEAIHASADRQLLANPDLAPALDKLSSFAGERGRKAFQAVDEGLAALDRYTNAKLVADWVVLQL